MTLTDRRKFLQNTALGVVGAGLASSIPSLLAQVAGDRPLRAKDVTVLNPRARVPVGLIIDDSTCLVNLNRFAMPQFDTAFGGANPTFQRNWREWPSEIPDGFVRKFGEWCAARDVKGKYSIVPYPACVGRLDRMLPGWTQRELNESLELVRTAMLPNWDIHPEICTHTRIIDTKTGHPYPDHSLKFMENWDWTTGRSADEIAEYMAYGLRILKDVGLPGQGITTPGGFGISALPQLAQATLQSVRDVFGAEIPHYFRHIYDSGTESVAPRVEYAGGLNGSDPRCVVSIIGCTADWTGGWDNTPPGGVDKFITEDLQHGRMVEVIQRGKPALMVSHWTAIYWNGQELGFKIVQEVARRLQTKFDNLLWMKLSEVARYWAAKELTQIELIGSTISLRAPFACPDFTLKYNASGNGAPHLRVHQERVALKEVSAPLKLAPGTWCREGQQVMACFALSKGASQLIGSS
jgi:hypothetical protein